MEQLIFWRISFPLLGKNVRMWSVMEKQNQLLDKIKEIIYRASLVILLGMFLFILRYAFFDYQSMPFLDAKASLWQKGLLMGVGVMLLLQVVSLLKNWMKKLSDKTCKILIGILFGILFVCQLAFLYTMKIQPRYDALKVLDEAVSLCKTGSVSSVHLDGYFARYTNNYPILFLTALFLKIGRFVGIVDANYHGAVFFLGFVNMIAIDAAIYILMKLIQKLSGIRSGLLFTLCVSLNPLFIIWVPFYYTNTLAMPFLALILYFFYCVFIEQGQCKKAYSAGLSMLLGGCVVAGIKIRATTVITLVACVLYLILAKAKSKEKLDEKSDRKKHLKEMLLKVSCMFLGIVATLYVYKVVEVRLVPFDYTDSAFPAIHWINMGAGGTGEYSILDEQMTMSYGTAAEKSAANWESYLTRVKEQGINGYLSLMFQKLKLTFSDAGAGYRSELGVSDAYNDANLYLVGGKADLIGYGIQLQYVFSLFCMVYGVIKLLVDKKKCSNYYVVVFWNIAGAFVFHMIWEAGNIYSLSFVLLFPVSIIFAADSGNIFSGVSKNKKILVAKRIVSGMIVLFTILAILPLYPAFTKQQYETNDAVVNQYIYHWGDSDELQMGEELIQSFYGNRPFNRLSFQVRNTLFAENDGVYQVQLLDENMECLQEFSIHAKDYGDYDFVRLEVDDIAYAKQKYYIKILKTEGSENCNLVFLSYRTGNYDAYTYGELQNGENLQDLCFSVYMTKEEPYCGKVVFGIMLGMILLAEILIQISSWYLERKMPEEENC